MVSVKSKLICAICRCSSEDMLEPCDPIRPPQPYGHRWVCTICFQTRCTHVQTPPAPSEIPVSAAHEISVRYGCAQVIILARDTDRDMEHVVTYGRGEKNRAVVARWADFLKYQVLHWIRDETEGVHAESRTDGAR